MFSRIFLVLAAAGIIFTAATFRPTTASEKDQVLLDMIVNGIQQNHYADIAIDDKFSERVYTLFLKNGDWNALSSSIIFLSLFVIVCQILTFVKLKMQNYL